MSRKGIDISHHNGTVDFKKVKQDGYDFVIIRAGFGKTGEDRCFTQNIRGAIQEGLDIGVYWFVYAKTMQDVKSNVRKMHSLILNYRKNINLGVWCDFEYDSDRYAGYKLDKNTRTKFVKTFIEEGKKLGYDMGLYANPDYINSKFNYATPDTPNLHRYPLWLAYYNTEAEALKYNPKMWQETSKGVVNGVKGFCDLDRLYDGSEDAKKVYGKVVTNGSNLNVRESNNTKSKVLGKFANGTEIELIEKKGSWWYASDGNVTGYVYGKYVKEVLE